MRLVIQIQIHLYIYDATYIACKLMYSVFVCDVRCVIALMDLYLLVPSVLFVAEENAERYEAATEK